jgi:adenosylmethionine-8-amino-7-oxononanoate aminotransferase
MKALEALPMVGQVRGRKLMICVENVADKATRALLPEDLDVGTRIADTCEAMGLMVRPLGHLNVMSPPLTLTAEDVGMVGDTLERAIRQVADDLVREGVKLG